MKILDHLLTPNEMHEEIVGDLSSVAAFLLGGITLENIYEPIQELFNMCDDNSRSSILFDLLELENQKKEEESGMCVYVCVGLCI